MEYFILLIVILLFVLFFGVLYKKRNDKSSVVLEHENALLSQFDPEYHEDVLNYVRTLQLSDRLGLFLVKDATKLDIILQYLSVKFAIDNVKFTINKIEKFKSYDKK